MVWDYIGCNDMDFLAVCEETELLIMELLKLLAWTALLAFPEMIC